MPKRTDTLKPSSLTRTRQVGGNALRPNLKYIPGNSEQGRRDDPRFRASIRWLIGHCFDVLEKLAFNPGSGPRLSGASAAAFNALRTEMFKLLDAAPIASVAEPAQESLTGPTLLRLVASSAKGVQP